MNYALPDQDPYNDWRRHEVRGFVPNARQQVVIESVRRALAQSLYYNTDVRDFCAKDLAITPEVDMVGRGKVEGGTFGSDLYYARGYLRAQETFKAEDAAAAELALTPGKVLGVCIFSDYKRTTGVTVTEVWSNDLGCEFTGKRGRVTVSGKGTALQLKNSMDRAKERAARVKAAV